MAAAGLAAPSEQAGVQTPLVSHCSEQMESRQSTAEIMELIFEAMWGFSGFRITAGDAGVAIITPQILRAWRVANLGPCLLCSSST